MLSGMGGFDIGGVRGAENAGKNRGGSGLNIKFGGDGEGGGKSCNESSAQDKSWRKNWKRVGW